MAVTLESGFAIPLPSSRISGTHSLDFGCVWVSHADLTPGNLENLKELLRSEDSTLSHWLFLAFSYKNIGNFDAFESLLREAETISNAKGEDDESTGMLYSALAIHNLRQSEQFRHDEKRHIRHVNLANHYMSKSEKSQHYCLCIAKGQYHLLRFLQSRKHEDTSRAKELFQTAASIRPMGVIPTILYANALVMEGNIQTAEMFYMRALILCNYYEVIQTLHISEYGDHSTIPAYELKLLRNQLCLVKSLLFFGLAACRFLVNEIEDAMSLVTASLSICSNPVVLRLKGAIAALCFLSHAKSDLDENNAGKLESNKNIYHDVKSALLEWSDATSLAYKLDPTSVIGQLHICEFLFQKGKIDECERRLNEIKRQNLSNSLQAELYFQQGRCAHVKNEFQKASSLYLAATTLRVDFVSSRLHLIKTAMSSENLSMAKEHCDLLLQHHLQKTVEILRLSGFVYMITAVETLDKGRCEMLQIEGIDGTSGEDLAADTSCLLHCVQLDVGRLVDERLFKALGLLEEAIKFDNEDELSLEYRGRCLEILITRGRESLCPKLRENYQSLFELKLRSEGVVLKPEWRNNSAIMDLHARMFDTAIETLEKLLEELKTNDNGSDTRILTVKFNLALCRELSGNISRAQRIYAQMTREFPKYTPPWLRRSIIAFQKNDIESSKRYLEQLKQVHRKSIEPWLQRAHQLVRLYKHDEAIHELRRLFRTIPASSYDPYANTLLSSALIERGYRTASGRRGVILPKEALHYAKVGLRRPAVCNFYAANCIAVILAHEKHLKPAYESFGFLLENVSTTSHMKLIANKNLGIFSAATALMGERKVEKGNFDRIRVAKAHQHFMAAMSNGRLDKHLYFAYTRFLFDTCKFEECVNLLESAREIFPDDLRFLYNQVLVLDGMICRNLRDPDKASSAVEMLKMMASAKCLKSNAEYLIELCEGNPGFITEKMKNSLGQLQQLLNRVKDKVIPHLKATLPQLELACEARQKTREKRLQLQLTIQQTQEAKRIQQEMERQREAQVEAELSQKLLKEASEIASELLLSRSMSTTSVNKS